MKLNTSKGLTDKFSKFSRENQLVCLVDRNRAYWMFESEGHKFIIKFDMQGHYHVYLAFQNSNVFFPIIVGDALWHEEYYSRFDMDYVNRVINCYACEHGSETPSYISDEGYFWNEWVCPVLVCERDGSENKQRSIRWHDGSYFLTDTLSYYSYLYI